jgi:hypothetical protein
MVSSTATTHCCDPCIQTAVTASFSTATDGTVTIAAAAVTAAQYQVAAMRWNCDRLREAMTPLVGYYHYTRTSHIFDTVYAAEYMQGVSRKLGLPGLSETRQSDVAFVAEVTTHMESVLH